MAPYGKTLDQIEELLDTIPIEELRSDVILAESVVGKTDNPTLPSGRTFDQFTSRARLWLDFIVELRALDSQQKEMAR